MIPFIKKLFTNKTFVLILWFGLSLFAAIKQIAGHAINNYAIYKQTFFHLIHQQNLYTTYPQFYFDSNHYGPIFGLVIAPFAVLPDAFGIILWVLFNAYILYLAITLLSVSAQKQVAVLLICAHELMTAAYNLQSNGLMAAIILLSFIFIKNKRDFWAACLIILGTYIKLYGIVGLAFFFFSNNKLKFILSLAFWAAVLFVLPMLVSSPHFVVQSYHDWFNSLSAKEVQNAVAGMQDISVKGMIRRIFEIQVSDMVVLIPAVLLFLTSYLRFGQFNNLNFQLLILASTLIFPVIFSNSSESPTYIIAMVGVAVWYINLNRPVSPFEIFLLVFAVVVTSFSPSDLFPRYIRSHYVSKYALKALPCFAVWLKIIYESWARSFVEKDIDTLAV